MNRIVNITKIARPGQIAPNLLDRQFGEGKWVYVGWENLRYWLDTSPLANPYESRSQRVHERTGNAVRQEGIAHYRCWLRGQIEMENPDVLTALRQIGPDTVLVCWCAPESCHAEVVANAAAWLRERDRASVDAEDGSAGAVTAGDEGK